MTLQQEGTFVFELDPDDSSWVTNDKSYSFGRIEAEGVILYAHKHSDKTLEIVISGALYQTFAFRTDIPSPKVPRSYVKVAIAWGSSEVRLFINGVKIGAIKTKPQIRAKLGIYISGHNNISLDVIGAVLKNLGIVFNFLSGALITEDASVMRAVFDYKLDENNFTLLHSEYGSFKGVIDGTKDVFNYLNERGVDLLAVLNGYSKRMTDAHVSGKEAKAMILNAQAQQEQIKTIGMAHELIDNMSKPFEEYLNQLSPEERCRVIESNFETPMKDMADVLIKHALQLELIKDDEPDTK